MRHVRVAGTRGQVGQLEVGTAEDRDEHEPVRIASTIPLVQAVDIDFEIGRRLPLERRVGGWPPASTVTQEQRLCVRIADSTRGIRRVRRIGGADHQRLLARGIEEIDADIGCVDEQAHLADPGIPPVADEQVAVPRHLARLLPVHPVQRPRQFEAVEIEWPTPANVDLAADAAFDQVGGTRFIDFERGDRAGREILDLDEAAFRGEDLAAVIGRAEIGQAAHRDTGRLAAATRHLHARYPRERGRRERVRQLADILGDDRIDDAVGIALDRLRGLQAATKAGHDDLVTALGRALLDRRLGCGGVGILVRRRCRLGQVLAAGPGLRGAGSLCGCWRHRGDRCGGHGCAKACFRFHVSLPLSVAGFPCDLASR